MPSHRMNSGTQAMRRDRRAAPAGSDRAAGGPCREAPESAPSRMPAAAPRAKPTSDAPAASPQTWVQSSPVRRASQASAMMRLGGGISRPAPRPGADGSSQPRRQRRGSSRPRSTRRSAARRFPAGGGSRRERRRARWEDPVSRSASACRQARSRCYCPDVHASSRRAAKTAVDQAVDRGLHVDVGRHDAGLAASARPAARIVSACGLPMVAWVSSVRSSWRSITGSGSLVQATRIFFSSAGLASDQRARLLVDLEHALHELRVLLGELLAHVEHAPGVGLGLAVEQPARRSRPRPPPSSDRARPRRPRRRARARCGRPGAAAARASRPSRSAWPRRARARGRCAGRCRG